MLIKTTLAFLAMAGLAHATNFTVSESDPGPQVVINDENVYANPITLSNTVQSFQAYCIDASRNIYLGQTYNYTRGPTLTVEDSQALTGLQLSASQVNMVNGLVRKPFSAPNQIAIWYVEGNRLAVQANTNQIIASVLGRINVPITTLATPGGQTLVGGVPEPASWTLMLIGVGGIGGMMRQRKTIYHES